MNELDLNAIINLIGDNNVQKLRDGITDIILEKIRNDIEDGMDWLFDPEIYTEFITEIFYESKEKLKPIAQKKLKEMIEKFKTETILN